MEKEYVSYDIVGWFRFYRTKSYYDYYMDECIPRRIVSLEKEISVSMDTTCPGLKLTRSRKGWWRRKACTGTPMGPPVDRLSALKVIPMVVSIGRERDRNRNRNHSRTIRMGPHGHSKQRRVRGLNTSTKYKLPRVLPSSPRYSRRLFSNIKVNNIVKAGLLE